MLGAVFREGKLGSGGSGMRGMNLEYEPKACACRLWFRGNHEGWLAGSGLPSSPGGRPRQCSWFSSGLPLGVAGVGCSYSDVNAETCLIALSRVVVGRRSVAAAAGLWAAADTGDGGRCGGCGVCPVAALSRVAKRLAWFAGCRFCASAVAVGNPDRCCRMLGAPSC